MWDERYAASDFAYGKKANDFLVSLGLKANGRQKVLCLAEGEGRNAVYLAQLGFEVLAVDQSGVGLQKALRLADENNVRIEVEQADLSNYKVPASTYAGIVSIYGHFNPATRIQIHKESLRGLMQGGIFVIEAYSKEQPQFESGGPSDEKLLYSLDEIEADFDEQLDFIIKRNIKRPVLEGKYHTGVGSVIQIFGTKR